MSKALISIVTILTLFIQTHPIRVYLMGGACVASSAGVFQGLASLIPGKVPMPGQCDPDWKTTKCPKVAVVTSAAANQQAGNDSYNLDDGDLLSTKGLFIKYGMSPQHVSVHIDNYLQAANLSTAAGQANLNLLSDADIIWFNGGDQARHLRSWLKDDGTPNELLELLRKRAMDNLVILSGSSAGSMIWGKKTFGSGSAFGVLYFHTKIGLAPKKIEDGGVGRSGLADDRFGNNSLEYSQNAGWMPAFGWMPFPADTHFNARGRLGRVIPVLLDLKETFAVGIDENTSFFYDKGFSTVYGANAVTFVNNSAASIRPADYLIIQNSTVTYLTEGDTYNFTSGVLQSAKPLITTPYYNRPTDSINILSAYECSLLETRLVDQTSVYNLGRTVTPSGFPSNTPMFELEFRRMSSTKGYYQRSKYTAVDVVVGVTYQLRQNLQSEAMVQ